MPDGAHNYAYESSQADESVAADFVYSPMLLPQSARAGRSDVRWLQSVSSDVTKPSKFIAFGAMDVTRPYEFDWFGAMDAAQP